MQDRYTLKAGGKPFAVLPSGTRDQVRPLARQVAAELEIPVTVEFGDIEVAQISPTPLSQALSADEEAQLFNAMMRTRRQSRPDGTPAVAMDETLIYQHPPAVPENMPSGSMPFLIEEPRATSPTAAWLSYRDLCASLMRTFPLDMHAKALFEAANRALLWRRDVPPERRFWEGADDEAEGYTFIIGPGRVSRWVPAPISKAQLTELAQDVADDYGVPVIIYERGRAIGRVSMRQPGGQK